MGTTRPASIFPNAKGFKGSSPNSIAVSPNGGFLYLTNGGANSVAVIQLGQNSQGNDNAQGDQNGGATSQLLGLIPTGWYPNSASVSADGSMPYVVNGKSNAGRSEERR